MEPTDPNNEFGNAAPTHINAYYADLETAEQELLVAKGKVEAAKQAILDQGGELPETAAEAEDDNAPLAKPAKSKKTAKDVPVPEAESVAATSENDTAEPAEEQAVPDVPAEDDNAPQGKEVVDSASHEVPTQEQDPAPESEAPAADEAVADAPAA